MFIVCLLYARSCAKFLEHIITVTATWAYISTYKLGWDTWKDWINYRIFNSGTQN